MTSETVDDDIFRCEICKRIPDNHTNYNPCICMACGKKVCEDCYQSHRRLHLNAGCKQMGDRGDQGSHLP